MENSFKSHMKYVVFLHVFNDISVGVYVFLELFIYSSYRLVNYVITTIIQLCSYIHTCIICTYICNLYYYVVAANTVIAHPGQDVELSCSLATLEGTGWLVGNEGPYGVSSLLNGILDGYSAHIQTNSLMIVGMGLSFSVG